MAKSVDFSVYNTTTCDQGPFGQGRENSVMSSDTLKASV